MTATAQSDAGRRDRLIRIADGLAVAVAASLPWSTSATSILVALWVVMLIPTLAVEDLRDAVKTPIGGLPVALVVFASLGLLWSDVSGPERWSGFTPFVKLLVLPLLVAQFRRSERGLWVLAGFLASCVTLLLASVISVLFAELANMRLPRPPGVVVKDYLTQSGEFIVCGFALLYLALEGYRARRHSAAAFAFLLAIAFFLNVFFIATSRTTLIAIPVILLLFAVRQFRWKAIIAVLACGVLAGAAVWMSSSHVREKVTNIAEEIERYQSEDFPSSSGLRLIFWVKSVAIISDKPVFGHGTGSIRAKFAPLAKPGEGASSYVATNPHNQILSVAIQLGIAGAALLLAMWFAHLVAFWQPGLVAWIGLLVVVQNVIGSQLNSHLFDFTQGWLYVFGVGTAGGMMFRKAEPLPAIPWVSVKALAN